MFIKYRLIESHETSTRVKSLILWLITLLLLLAIVFLQLRYDAIVTEHLDMRAPVHRFVMPAPVMRHLAFGFENVLADYYWINAVQDINKWDRRDTFYPEYFRIISTLDPKFEYPYIFAALTMPSKGVSESLGWLSVIAERGMHALPESWQIPFYVGVQYHVVAKSYEQAVHYLAIAAKEESAPEMVRSIYGIYLMHTGSEYETSRALFATIYETSSNKETKRIAKERIALLDLIEMLEQAASAYKAKYASYPVSVDQLSAKGYIELPHGLAKKFPLSIDQTTVKVIVK